MLCVGWVRGCEAQRLAAVLAAPPAVHACCCSGAALAVTAETLSLFEAAAASAGTQCA